MKRPGNNMVDIFFSPSDLTACRTGCQLTRAYWHVRRRLSDWDCPANRDGEFKSPTIRWRLVVTASHQCHSDASDKNFRLSTVKTLQKKIRIYKHTHTLKKYFWGCVLMTAILETYLLMGVKEVISTPPNKYTGFQQRATHQFFFSSPLFFYSLSSTGMQC